MRPGYPPQLFDDLAALARLGEGSRVLEIGCGTGQATVPLAERGYEIVAVEIGTELASFARRRLAAFSNVQVVVASFEDWPLPRERFDAVVSATAFHWLDPDLRAHLRDGAGVLRTLGPADTAVPAAGACAHHSDG